MALRTSADEHSTEVTGLISDLYAISSSLSSLEDLSKDARYRRNWSRIHSDLELVRSSLKYTIEDIFDFFGRLNGADSPPETFKRVWVSMGRFFWDESQYSLATRFAKYKTFLRELGDLVKDRGHDSPLLAGFRSGVKSLLAVQEKRLVPSLSRLSLGRNPPSSGSAAEPISPVSDRRRNDRRRRRSYERTRPPGLSPQSPLSPVSGTFSDVPPSVPEAPGSPLTGSASATTNTSTNASTSTSIQPDVIQYHWIKDVFTGYDTETPLPPSREKAGCFDDPHTNIKQVLREQGFERILQLAFNDAMEMTVYFYLREKDHRARIVCKVPHPTRPSEYYCLPLNMLEIIRSGSCLQLCRRRNGGSELVLWATLKFTDIESMVVFFCSFLALRSQDAGKPVVNIRDHELEGEDELYGGQIIDDDYPHALRVYQDTITGAVRLQASVHLSDMDRTPVWTAFVTPHLGRRGWLRLSGPKTVVVRDLNPIIMMSADDYNPPQLETGEHVLKFTSRGDADAFLDTMEEAAMTFS
ncbi:hypothetical protein N7492_008358 [Penicillium capsulatum]|uniref:Uncharacterized protein n=1 Tax=Penicillium capsulatum TaxID=69766 RepID=A0A9W9HSJ2_9EURO|nr:hypothetical protein N7492_008358 [Penicillium capsulatum]